jgi:threonyl-tRNA synthetase
METVSTLRFAERIKQVKIKSKKNVTLDPVAEIKKEMEEMQSGQVAVRARGGVDLGAMPLDRFAQRLSDDIAARRDVGPTA